MSRRPDNRVLYACLALVMFVAVTLQAWHAIAALRFLIAPEERVSGPFILHSFSDTVTEVSPEATAAGLRQNDRIVSIQGQPYRGFSTLARPLAVSRPGQPLDVVIERGGQTRKISIVLRSLYPRGLQGSAFLQIVFLTIVSPLIGILLGFWVTAVRPRDPLAWILLFLLLSFSQVPSPAVWISEWEDILRIPAVIYRALLGNLWAVGMLLFGLYFPERIPFERRHSWVKWLLIAPLCAFAILNAAVAAGESENFSGFAWAQRISQSLGIIPFIMQSVTIGIFFSLLGWKSGTASTLDARRRLKLLLGGSQLSLTPTFILIVRGLVTGKNPFSSVPIWVSLTAHSLMLLFPAVLAYVIVVQRAMDVRVAIRQGVQYALARSGVRVVQVLVSAGVIFASISLTADPNVNRPGKILHIAVGVLLVFLIRGAAEGLRRWTDRRFFRDAYNAEQILTDLTEKVRTIVETRPLLETVAQRISDSLHVPRIATVLRDNGHYALAHTLGFSDAPTVAFPAESVVLEHVQRSKEPLRVYAGDADSWVNKDERMDCDRRKLLELDTQLLLPLAVKEKLLGFISLGPKRSEEPYSHGDLRLLRSVASQTGLALENSRLTAAVAAEAAQRERLNREVEIAREVQERLFPQNLPPVPCLDYAGKCRPALGVGGDYFDFLGLPERRLGIAIGDVSGKGIAAALLMASLQASLRGQTMSGSNDLALLMGNVNRLIFDASPSNRYATFFYAQFDPATRELAYVNGGHNAPMLFRASTGQVERLADGGPVIGLFRPARYQQGSVKLESGDVLIGYTDGISEAMNSADEDWGEDRMIATIWPCIQLRAPELIDHIVREADAFAAGAPQHDDMTLVVVRMV